MNEKLLLLERSIQRDLEAIECLYAAIGTEGLADDRGLQADEGP